MPYISYEEFDREQTVGRLINSTFADRELEKLNIITNANNQADRLMKLFKKYPTKINSKGKERSRVDETDHANEEQLGGINKQAVGSEDSPMEFGGSTQYARY